MLVKNGATELRLNENATCQAHNPKAKAEKEEEAVPRYFLLLLIARPGPVRSILFNYLTRLLLRYSCSSVIIWELMLLSAATPLVSHKYCHLSFDVLAFF